MTMVRAGDVELFVERLGHGPPCVVIHGGLGVDHTTLRGLDPLGSHVELVYYDQRGHGASERVDAGSVTMEQLADDVAALTAALGFGSATVLGVSFGGFVALEHVLRHPERVDRLVLIGTAAHGNYFGEIMAGIRQRKPGPEIIAAMSTPPDDDEAAARAWDAILPLYLAPDSDIDGIRAQLAGTKVDIAMSNRGMQIWSGWNVRGRLGEIKCPTLVFGGKYDYICPATQARIIADGIPDATLADWDDCGHFMWLEQPERFFDTVGAWLNATVDTISARSDSTLGGT